MIPALAWAVLLAVLPFNACGYPSPYEAPALKIGPVTLHAFGALVAVAILWGHSMLVKRTERYGGDGNLASDFLLWMVAVGFPVSHWIEVITYQPQSILEDPLILLKIWEGISSWGGWVGGILGGLIFMKRRGLSRGQMWTLMDITAYIIPFAWFWGRLGCAVAHDHPGLPVDGVKLPAFLSWLPALAVEFPIRPGSPEAGVVARFDLGLLEMIWLAMLAVLFFIIDRRGKRPVGFWIGAYFVFYSPIRFLLDSLRVQDTEYLGWTPGQYFSVAAMAIGAFVWFLTIRAGEHGLSGGDALPPPKKPAAESSS